jgi:hypothetical protein
MEFLTYLDRIGSILWKVAIALALSHNMEVDGLRVGGLRQQYPCVLPQAETRAITFALFQSRGVNTNQK